MSKSMGNVVRPQDVMKTLGADIIRLWVAATDYRGEMSVSDEILKRTADAYRRIRNTARFLLANLNGFDPAVNLVAPADMLALDRWAVDRALRLQEEIVAAYRDYQFHLIYQKVHNFCVVDLGGFYLDVIKDRQYTTQADGLPRRSCQTRPVPHRRGHDPLAGAHPELHRRRDLALSARARGPSRSSWRPGTRGSSRLDTGGRAWTGPSGTRSWRPASPCRRTWRRRARPGPSAPPWMRNWTSGVTPPSTKPWPAWRTNCASP